MSVKIEVVDNYVYRTDQRLGEGAFGKVFYGKEISTNKPVAVKKIHLQRYRKDIIDTLYKREIEILNSIDNNHVIKLIANMETKNHKILILELCDMNLRQLLEQVGRIEEKYALRLFREILEGLQSLHMQHYCHRDIKPDNILLKDGRIKIIDVNISKRFTDRKLRTTSRIGTPKYMAPEIQYQTSYAPYKADIYSLGVVFYEILYGIQPKNWRQNLQFNDTITVSKKIKSLIENMIKQRPKERLDWEDVSTILMSFWAEEQSTSLIQYSLQNYYIEKWQCSVFFLKSVIKNIKHVEEYLPAPDFCALLITKAIKSKIEKIIIYLQKQGETVLKKAYLNEIGKSSSELIKKRNFYLTKTKMRLENQDAIQKDLLDIKEYLEANCEDTSNLYQIFMEEFTKNEMSPHFQYFFQYYLKQFYLNISELKNNLKVNQLSLRTLFVQILVALDYFNDYENAQDLLQESGLISSIYQSEIIPKIKAKEQQQQLSRIIENYWNESEELQISQKHFQTVDEAETYCVVLEKLLDDQYSNEQYNY